MDYRGITNTLNVLLVIWFFCTPLFWHLDLTRGTAGFYDTFALAPYAIFHIFTFYILLLLSLLFCKLSLCHILLMVLYFPIIQIVNYPYLTMRDVYLHAEPAETLMVNGKLASSMSSTAASWPASYILHGILTIISGYDLVNANYILYLSLIILLALLLYCFTKKLEGKGYKLAWASALMFPCLFFNYNFSNFNHYSRNAIAFILFFLFLFVFSRFKDRRGIVLQVLIILSIIITHPFQSIALVFFLASYAVLNIVLHYGNFNSVRLALFSISSFMGWMIFQGYSKFVEATKQLKTLFSEEYIKPIVESLSSSERLPWWGTVLRDYYKYSLVALLAVAFFSTIILLFREKRRSNQSLWLSSILISSVLMMFSLNLLPDWQIFRFVMFAAFPAAFSSFLILEELLKRKKVNISFQLLRIRAKKSVILVFVLSLSATVMVSNFETNYYFGELCHPVELSSLEFFFTYDQNSTVYVVSWRTNLYCPYFNFNSSHQTLMLWYLELGKIGNNASEFQVQQNVLINQSQAVVRGMRDEFVLFRLDSPEKILRVVDETMILPNFNQVYSNGNYTVYIRHD